MTSRPENLGPNGFEDSRKFTEEDESQIDLCKRWISTFIEPRKTLNDKTYSYGMKHIAEDWAGSYVSNGAFIAAAIDLGYRYKQAQGKKNPNAIFNMSLKGYEALWKRCPSCGKRVGENTRIKGGETGSCPKCHAELLWEKEGILKVTKLPDF